MLPLSPGPNYPERTWTWQQLTLDSHWRIESSELTDKTLSKTLLEILISTCSGFCNFFVNTVSDRNLSQALLPHITLTTSEY